MVEKDSGRTAKSKTARKKPARGMRTAVRKPAGGQTAKSKRSDTTKTRAKGRPAARKSSSKRRAAKASTVKKTDPQNATKNRPAAKAAVKKAALSRKAANKDFVPTIVAFACNWCSYAGADNAGVNRVQYSPNFRVIRTMCSGRVTPAFVLKAFKLGADGVLVSGCHFGDCHYIFGNYRAVEQFEKTKALVRTLGLDERRVRLEWVSAAEGTRWGEVIDEFVAQIAELGPSPLNHGKQAKQQPGACTGNERIGRR